MCIISKLKSVLASESIPRFTDAWIHHLHRGWHARDERRRHGTSKAGLRRVRTWFSGVVLALTAQVTCIQALQGVTLAWDRSPDPTVVGYRIHYGVAHSAYSSTRDVGNAVQGSITGLSGGTTYYFAVTAYNSSGLESGFSNEVGYTAPVSSSPPIVTLTSITVTPTSPTLLVGTSQQFTATARYSDGSTRNLTSQAVWASSRTSVATISSSGLAKGVAAGSATISASAPGVTGSQTLAVSASPPTITLTSPVSGGVYSAPATVNLAASVTANGHSITKVQFLNGTKLVREDTSAPYTYAWSNVGVGSYSLTARAVYDASKTVSSSPVSVNVTALPAPWQSADIGSVGVAGSASVANGVYTVKGAGTLSGKADQFRYVYQRLSGNGEIKARVNSLQNTGNSARIGLVIRESLTSGSRYAFMGVTPGGRFRWQDRISTSGSTWSTTSVVGTPPNMWLRLIRSGNTLYGYASTDGVKWRKVTSRSIAMASNIYVGLAVASGSSGTLNTATFANVTVVP